MNKSHLPVTVQQEEEKVLSIVDRLIDDIEVTDIIAMFVLTLSFVLFLLQQEDTASYSLSLIVGYYFGKKASLHPKKLNSR